MSELIGWILTGVVLWAVVGVWWFYRDVAGKNDNMSPDLRGRIDRFMRPAASVAVSILEKLNAQK